MCIIIHFLGVYGYVYMVTCMQVDTYVQMCVYICGIQRKTSGMVPRVSSNFSF